MIGFLLIGIAAWSEFHKLVLIYSIFPLLFQTVIDSTILALLLRLLIINSRYKKFLAFGEIGALDVQHAGQKIDKNKAEDSSIDIYHHIDAGMHKTFECENEEHNKQYK